MKQKTNSIIAILKTFTIALYVPVAKNSSKGFLEFSGSLLKILERIATIIVNEARIKPAKEIDAPIILSTIIKCSIFDLNSKLIIFLGKATKQIKKYLRDKFQEQIDAYNKVKDDRVFFLLRDKNKELQRANVKLNYIINDKLDDVLQEIKNAYKIQNTSWEIASIFYELFNSRTMYFKNDSGSHITIQSLMNKMVVDKELYNELQVSMDTFFKRFHRDSVPFDIHFINHRETYIKVFEKSMARFQKILDNAEPSNKVLYIQSRLKELKQRELQFRTLIEKREDFKSKEDKYPNLFKEFLTIEAEFIKETAIIAPLTYLPENPKILLDKPKVESFEELLSTEKQTYILQMLEDLAITVEGHYILSQKKTGAIRGVVEALREKKIIPHIGLHKLCLMFAGKINATMKSELDASNTSEDYKKTAIEYIKINPLH